MAKRKTILIRRIGEAKELLKACERIKTPSNVALFRYLADQEEGTQLTIDEDVYKRATGFSRASYYRAIKHLEELQYIYEDYGARLIFETSAVDKPRNTIHNWGDE